MQKVKCKRIKEQTFLFEYGKKLLYHITRIFFDTLDRKKKIIIIIKPNLHFIKLWFTFSCIYRDSVGCFTAVIMFYEDIVLDNN